MRQSPDMVWADHPSPCLAVWAAASTPRLLTWALTWSARSRRTFLRTTPATLPSLLVRLLLNSLSWTCVGHVGYQPAGHKAMQLVKTVCC